MESVETSEQRIISEEAQASEVPLVLLESRVLKVFRGLSGQLALMARLAILVCQDQLEFREDRVLKAM